VNRRPFLRTPAPTAPAPSPPPAPTRTAGGLRILGRAHASGAVAPDPCAAPAAFGSIAEAEAWMTAHPHCPKPIAAVAATPGYRELLERSASPAPANVAGCYDRLARFKGAHPELVDPANREALLGDGWRAFYAEHPECLAFAGDGRVAAFRDPSAEPGPTTQALPPPAAWTPPVALQAGGPIDPAAPWTHPAVVAAGVLGLGALLGLAIAALAPRRRARGAKKGG
jgi:hypothetical protein